MSEDEVQIVSVTKARRKQPVEDDVVILELPSEDQYKPTRSRKRKLKETSYGSEDDEVKIIKVSKQDNVINNDSMQSDMMNNDSKSSTSANSRSPGPDTPVYWTKCDKCGSLKRRYHLIEVHPNCHEWLNVCIPLLNENLFVTQLQRIQNCMLWQRLQCERHLMSRSHPPSFDLNERLLYHTSRAKKEIICAEGLDPRLGNSGSFGRGIYFSDNPTKCNRYWAEQGNAKRVMFACRVLLGDIKVYNSGQCDQSLVREPPRSSRGTTTFDSVLGNPHGYNEFVVYNAYRVMPEYVIEYETNCLTPPLMQVPPHTPHSTRPSVPMCHLCGELTNSRHCQCTKL